MLALLRAERVPEPEGVTAIARSAEHPMRRQVVVFQGMSGLFDPLVPQRELIRRRLQAILSSRVRAMVDALPPATPIAVHVRRGDSKPIAFREPYTLQKIQALPIEWFIGCVRSVREAIGTEAPLTVYSDAHEAELRPLLELPNVRRSPAAPPIVDMLALARSPVLITSSASTFSGWACFLGNSVNLWYPGSRAEFGSRPAPGSVEADYEGRLADEDRHRVAEAVKSVARGTP
jgi:hypothetical protein